MATPLPRLLIIDDLFGRTVASGYNRERSQLCAKFLLRDETGDEGSFPERLSIPDPIASAVFCRAQRPVRAGIGDVVRNDFNELERTIGRVEEGSSWALVLLDLAFRTGTVTARSDAFAAGMPEGRTQDDVPDSYFGLRVLEWLGQKHPELPVVILSSKQREDVSLEFSKKGALGFIDRTAEAAPSILRESIHQHGLLEDSSCRILGASIRLLQVLREARRSAVSNQNLLLLGERGVGKELVARYVHDETPHGNLEAAPRPMVTINSPALTADLYGAELFGIEPSTATGVKGRVGLIERADQGDVFLDEVADMPAVVQAGLLRVLQEGQLTRIGGHAARSVNVRFLAASNRIQVNSSAELREDLLDRLRLGGTISIPPLKERAEDIPSLVNAFVREAEIEIAGAISREVTSDALDILKCYDWPGNIRELRSAVFEAVRKNPHVEYLVPSHLGVLGEEKATSSALESLTHVVLDDSNDRVPDASDSGVEDLVSLMKSAQPNLANITDWAGTFSVIQASYRELAARLLGASIEATKKRTVSDPIGRIQIHPAVKLLLGNDKLTASQAADVVKQILGPLEDALSGELAQAYEVALRLRPKSGSRKSGGAS